MTEQPVSASSKRPWLIFAAGGLCPLLAYFVDAPGIMVWMSFALLAVGFAACVSAPWADDSNHPTTKTLLSFAAAGVYFCILASLLYASLLVGGLLQD